MPKQETKRGWIRSCVDRYVKAMNKSARDLEPSLTAILPGPSVDAQRRQVRAGIMEIVLSNYPKAMADANAMIKETGVGTPVGQ